MKSGLEHFETPRNQISESESGDDDDKLKGQRVILLYIPDTNRSIDKAAGYRTSSGPQTPSRASSVYTGHSLQLASAGHTMAYLFSGLLNWLRSLFFAKHLEVTIVGLQVR